MSAAKAPSAALPAGTYASELPAGPARPEANGSAKSSAHAAASLQSSGTLLYTPSGSTLSGADFSTFLYNAHANSAVSGVCHCCHGARGPVELSTPHDVLLQYKLSCVTGDHIPSSLTDPVLRPPHVNDTACNMEWRGLSILD